jgi:23S rRNA pseudouridine1911/1915/1917 synthase
VPRIEFDVTADSGEGTRLDVFLAGKVSGLTRSQLKKRIDSGDVRVGGEIRRAGFKLRAGDRVVIEYETRNPDRLEPQDVPFKILFVDAEIIVLDKPSGLVVHPGAGNPEGTLANALVYHFPEIAAIGPPDRPGIVHRLDKETSGVMVVARTDRAYESLLRQFKRRDVWKTYLGLALGRITAPEGRINWPLGRHATEGKKISVRSRHPKPAETFFAVLRVFKESTLLEIKPVTGRTHQIRVHLAAAGHPIAGDSLYGPKKKGLKVPRLFLHAHTLSFIHPATGERLTFASQLPPDLEAVLQNPDL